MYILLVTEKGPGETEEVGRGKFNLATHLKVLQEGFSVEPQRIFG